MMHEASLHPQNSFITLTYADEYLPAAGSLDKSAFPKFMKRLRKRKPDDRIRYFHCGEYGEQTGRPHYHACLFGFDFSDKIPWSVRNDHQVWRSGELEEIWPFGRSEVGSFTFESAAYTARYILKKVTGKSAEKHYEAIDPRTGEVVQKEPEYTTMSRRPGIGKEWFDKFKKEVYPSDEVIVRGKSTKPPRYYDNIYEQESPRDYESVLSIRRRGRRPEEETPDRLSVRKVCAEARIAHYTREVTE